MIGVHAVMRPEMAGTGCPKVGHVYLANKEHLDLNGNLPTSTARQAVISL